MINTLMVSLAILLSANPDTGQAQQVTRRDSARIWFSVGKDYFNKNNLERAIANFKRALSYDSTMVEIYLHLGQAYLKLGQFDSAEIAYRKVAEIDPKDSRGWQGLGFMYGIVKKDVEKGIEFYKKALEVDPGNNDARFGLATLLDKAGRTQEADSIYQAAIAADPENPAILKAYGVFLAQKKEYARALPYLEKAHEKKPQDEKVAGLLLDAYLNLAQQEKDKQTKRSYYEKALTLLDAKLAQDSTDVGLLIKRANVLASLGRVDEAIRDLDRAIELRPDIPNALLIKANLLMEVKKDYAGARKLLKKALEMDLPDNVRAATLALLADAYFYPAEALRKEADALRKKGLELEARKKYGEAVPFYDKAIQTYKKVLQYPGTRWTEYARKQVKRAQSLRKKAWRRSQGIE